MAGEGEAGRPGSGRSSTGKAVDLARLLHMDCTRLLDLYKERESFPSEDFLEDSRVVVVPLPCDNPSTDERVWILYAALGQCLGHLQKLISLEEETGCKDVTEEEYKYVRNNVHARLEHLLQSTRQFLVKDPDSGITEPPDGTGVDEADSSFQVKLWTYRVFEELIYWTGSASRILHLLHTEREADEEVEL
uniref:Uncharacterized protein n=1 Tax=Paramormyrops kingsleyae TaxID=1676925 RepID=A0A3B3RU55_9TELE